MVFFLGHSKYLIAAIGHVDGNCSAQLAVGFFLRHIANQGLLLFV